ncbi:hypothetical protein HMPREF1141_0373 [Clostridium sp. MSTE9]|nr:hypothetical protein HMPREF1141_0373 [Clostridium sp. MSTE9]
MNNLKRGVRGMILRTLFVLTFPACPRYNRADSFTKGHLFLSLPAARKNCRIQPDAGSVVWQ